MSTAVITNTAPTGFWPLQGVQVFAKRQWADDWTWLPYVVPTQATETLLPAVGQATFRYDFGRILRSGSSVYADWLPYYLNGAFVAIVSYNQYGSGVLWVGVVDVTNVRPDGRTDLPSGDQQFTAFALEHILDRREMFGAWIKFGSIEPQFIWSSPVFNRESDQGYKRFNGENDYVFSADDVGSLWNNQEIAQYIINWFTPGDFQLAGQAGILSGITEEQDFNGMTPLQALNRLIDRRRGMAWRIITDGDKSPFYVYVISTVPDQAGTIPPNPFQRNVQFAGYRAVRPEITINSLSLYDEILVEGGPLVTCFTVSYTDGTLTEAWIEELETLYKAGAADGMDTEADNNDSYRSQDLFDDVYQRHIVPTTFDWFAGDGAGVTYFNAAPMSTDFGDFDVTVQAPQRMTGKRFLRWIPKDTYVITADTQARPLVWCYVDDRWVQVDKLDSVELASANIDIQDNYMGIIARPPINHLFGSGHYDTGSPAPSNYEPEVNYQTIMATVAVETDTHLHVRYRAPSWWTQQVGRSKRIQVPQARVAMILPNAVTGVDDEGNLTYQNTDGNYTYVGQSWGPRLRSIGRLARQWYGTPRSTVRYTTRYTSIADPPGHMIRNIIGPEGVTAVNTVVTRRTWRWERGNETTTVETGFDDLSFEVL